MNPLFLSMVVSLLLILGACILPEKYRDAWAAVLGLVTLGQFGYLLMGVLQ